MRAAQNENAKPPLPQPPSGKNHPDWATLLANAVNTPGVLSTAYHRFWNYSVGNQIMALFECLRRGIEPGPIHTFRGWADLGRHIKRGEKAITLCMPVIVKCKPGRDLLEPANVRTGDGAERQLTGPGGIVPKGDGRVSVTVFTFKPHWFVLSQTEGADYIPTEIPDWSEEYALHALLIDRVRFDHPDGNCQGYATGRQVAVSPVAVLPHKTLFHELAHVLIGHTQESSILDDHDLTPRNLREVEAECVALICCESLSLVGAAESRGYIQHWLGTETIPDRSAQKIFKAADQILKAGHPAKPEEAAE